MRSFLAVLAVGLVALVAVGLTQRSSLVYSLGITPALRATQIAPGFPACQGPVRVPGGDTFDRVGFMVDPLTASPPVRVEVREAGGGRVLASGRRAGGYGVFKPGSEDLHVVKVDRPVETHAPLDLCLVDEGRAPVAVIGQAGIASPTTTATRAGKPISPDLAFELRRENRSLLALLPNIAERASRFRASWVTPGVYLVLALLILVGAPFLLARGLKSADAEDQRSSASTSRQ
jgi:hypothetical protein